jgi:acetolactate synthase-1/2/3 large subunit
MTIDSRAADEDVREVAARTGADEFLDILERFGVEHIFASSGTEWAPLWEALAKRASTGASAPDYFLSRHEDIAIGMASGYARATGKLGVCLVHSSVGAWRIGMGVRGAYLAEVPLLVCAGESITFGEQAPWVGFHWGRYLKDYGGPARVLEPVVKSSFTVDVPALLAGSVHRAVNLALAPTPGPVFLSLPFETLAAPSIGRAPTAYAMPQPAAVDSTGLLQAAELLGGARRPLIVTEKIGRVPEAVADLVTLAELTGAVVVEAQHPEYVNFPRQHDLHGGFNVKPYLDDADVILLLDLAGPPWYPEAENRPERATIIAIGDDPLRSRMPYHRVDADLLLVGSAQAAVAELGRLLNRPVEGAAERREASASRTRQARSEWHDAARRHEHTQPIDSRWMCEVLNRVLPDDAIVVDETIIQNFTILHVMDGLRPGQYVNAMDGGLGTGLGAALGVKVSAQDRPVVAILGDGAFMYNAPLAALAFCQEYRLPITIVIGNNGVYRAMKMATESLYPNGWSVRNNLHYGAFLEPAVDYARLADLFGGYGERVTDPARIEGALERAFAANREGRPAVLNVEIGDELEYLGPLMATEH